MLHYVFGPHKKSSKLFFAELFQKQKGMFLRHTVQCMLICTSLTSALYNVIQLCCGERQKYTEKKL